MSAGEYTKAELKDLRDFYKAGLLEDTLPFWMPEIVDAEFGGYLSMRDRDGTLIDDDKSVWLQGRFAWMLATLHNTVEPREEWLAALNANMLTPIDLIKATVDGMCERGYGRVVNITSSSVKSPIPTLGLSNGARAGLTGFVAGVARQVVAKGVTINGILPGPFDTDRLRAGVRYIAEQSGREFEVEFEQRKKTNPAGRYGSPEEFGALCAFLCSAHAGYINGQNIVIDGGGYPGTL